MNREEELVLLRETWLQAWPTALADWSRYVQLHEPIWCMNKEDEKREGLTGSFAMIRLNDHAVVVSLAQVHDQHLDSFAREILAHEIGHHVYCPADLTDNARLLARMRRGLPGSEAYAPMASNLYADLFINDTLQRSKGRDIAGVYRTIRKPRTTSRLWSMYMRTYEILWELERSSLSNDEIDSRINQDAVLCARLIRSYSKDWLQGAGRFACLLLPYLAEEAEKAAKSLRIWCDALNAGCDGYPDGLTEIDEDEIDGNIHPAEDPVLAGLDPIDLRDQELGHVGGRVRSELSGHKSLKQYRDPFEYGEILKASGVRLSPREIAIRYYRERALPYLIPFPARINPSATDPIPEGLDQWDVHSDIDQIDWSSTIAASPIVIPGITTRERLVGMAPGNEPERQPFDLYLGLDCSGSMSDPAITLSYPVLAGVIMLLSAIRSGARVKVVLSGEPGSTVSTDGFVRDANIALQTLLNYLGTGYAFGIHRLGETFDVESPSKRPVHILVISDYDMFSMLEQKGKKKLGWTVASEAVKACGGGATYVLQLPGFDGSVENAYKKNIDRMKSDGWNVHLVNTMEELLVFARQFSKQQYQR